MVDGNKLGDVGFQYLGVPYVQPAVPMETLTPSNTG